MCNRGPPRPQPRRHADHRVPSGDPARFLARTSEFCEFYDRDTPAVIDARPPRYSTVQGSTAVEVSIILSALLLLVIGSIELGRALWTGNTMLLAVQEAGRFAM